MNVPTLRSAQLQIYLHLICDLIWTPEIQNTKIYNISKQMFR